MISQEVLEWSARWKPSLHEQQLRAMEAIDLSVFSRLSEGQQETVGSMLTYDPISAVRYFKHVSSPGYWKQSVTETGLPRQRKFTPRNRKRGQGPDRKKFAM
jgi:hypothetical protein